MAEVQRRLTTALWFLLVGGAGCMGCASTQACGREPLPPRFYDPELLPFLDEFMEASFSKGVATILDPELRVMKYVPADFEDRGVVMNSSRLTIGLCITFDEYEEARIPHSYPRLAMRREGAWQEMWILDRGDGPHHGWDYWDLRILIYHELGHCLLGLGHTEGTIMDPTPVGVVKKGQFPGEDMTTVWHRAMERLFSMAKETGL